MPIDVAARLTPRAQPTLNFIIHSSIFNYLRLSFIKLKQFLNSETTQDDYCSKKKEKTNNLSQKSVIVQQVKPWRALADLTVNSMVIIGYRGKD